MAGPPARARARAETRRSGRLTAWPVRSPIPIRSAWRALVVGLLLPVLWLGPGPGPGWTTPAWAQEEATYSFRAGPASWGLASGEGLVGVLGEVEQRGVAVSVLWGIGTNRVQGWVLIPRFYLASGDEPWRAFGELSLAQISETELSLDPRRGLVRTVFTWQFMGVGLGLAYGRESKRLSLSLSAGLGVSGGQCAACGLLAYAGIAIGFGFDTDFGP